MYNELKYLLEQIPRWDIHVYILDKTYQRMGMIITWSWVHILDTENIRDDFVQLVNYDAECIHIKSKARLQLMKCYIFLSMYSGHVLSI